MAATRTITNAWIERKLPDIFYEQPVLAEEPVVQETTLDRIKHLLWARFGERQDVFISGLFYICYDITDGNRRLQPDCFIAFEVDAEAIRYNLPNYWIWEVGKAPDFVMEIGSPTTALNDLGYKRDMYTELGITEYWRFDPTGGELYGQPITGERLIDGEYEEYELHTESNGTVWGHSELLNLNFCWDGDEFDVLNPETGKTIDKLEIAEEALEAEREARIMERRAAEARERELLNEIARLRQQMKTD